MSTPSEIIDMVASLMNDTAQTVYTDAACLPYLNMALDELQETFELNNIPVTNETSAVIKITSGVKGIGAFGEPLLPPNLVEIQGLYERQTGTTDSFIIMSKYDFLPQITTLVSQLVYWAWVDNKIKFIGANSDVDVKIDHIKSIFSTPLSIGSINFDIPIKNIKSYLGYSTAALCSMFIGENETRAQLLEGKAINALDRALGIPIKGRQSIITRRRPFRSSYKRGGILHY